MSMTRSQKAQEIIRQSLIATICGDSEISPADLANFSRKRLEQLNDVDCSWCEQDRDFESAFESQYQAIIAEAQEEMWSSNQDYEGVADYLAQED